MSPSVPRCRGPTLRRSFLKIGTPGLDGLSLAEVLRVRAAAQQAVSPDTSVIFIWLPGGPPHMETYDMKPLAPADYRVSSTRSPRTYPASTPADWEAQDSTGAQQVAEATDYGSFVERMIEILRKSPVLRLEGNRTVTLKQVRPPATSLSLSAEAIVEGYGAEKKLTLSDAVQEAMEQDGQSLPLSSRPVAIVFGPENGAVSEKLVWEAAREAAAKSYTHLYVIGFMIQPNARSLVENCEHVTGIPATYVQATPDLLMGDLLKNMRSSQIFSVCGLPDVKVRKVKDGKVQVELLGLDTFDPATMDVEHRPGDDVPAWFLDTDYNGMCFHVSQAFFPRTSAWDNLRKALRGTHEESVWDHLAGTVSAPFEPGDHEQVAVKVIDDRGNELLVVKPLRGAK